MTEELEDVMSAIAAKVDAEIEARLKALNTTPVYQPTRQELNEAYRNLFKVDVYLGA